MVTALPVANTVMIKLRGTTGTGNWANIFYAQYTGTGPTVANLQSLATSLVSAYTTSIAPLASTGVILTGVDLADLTNPAASAVNTTANVPGTRAGGGLPAQVAHVSSWQINVRYRGGHPRTYWPWGVVTDLGTTRSWTAGFLTSAGTASAAWRTAINALTHGTTTYRMVSVSRFVGNTLRPTPLVFTVNGVSNHGRIDTQRSRLGKEIP